MRTRSALLTLGVVLLVATAGCAQVIGGAGSPSPSNANAPPSSESASGQTIQVAASGSVGANPNQAIVRVAVVTTADDVATARQQLTENVSRMREALAEIGINSSQISTAHYDIRQEREPRRAKQGEQPQYRAIHAFRITLSDLEKTGKVIDTAVTNGANRVEGVQFAITQQKRQQLRQQALEAAMANARQQAETLAGTSGLTVTGVKRIQTGQPRYHGYDAAMTTAAGSAGGTEISSGTITVSVQVQVAYNATATE